MSIEKLSMIEDTEPTKPDYLISLKRVNFLISEIKRNGYDTIIGSHHVLELQRIAQSLDLETKVYINKKLDELSRPTDLAVQIQELFGDF